MGGIFVLLHLEVTSNCTSDASDKTWSVWLHFYVIRFYLPFSTKCIYPLKF
jgi:hypothetical protein